MAYEFSLGDIAFLKSGEGADALDAASDLLLTERSLISEIDGLRRRWPQFAAAVAETVRLRRKAAAKLPGAHDWLFTDDAAQQATPTLVGKHRAQRLRGRAIHDVTCSIGADLYELAKTASVAVGSDLDPVRLAMAAANVPGAAVARADALRPCTRDAVLVADPARRTGARRTSDPSALQPPLPSLLSAYKGRDFVIKCAPGLDYRELNWEGETEIVSLDGGVRECTLWSPGVTELHSQTRATVLNSDGSSWSISSMDPCVAAQRAPGRFIIDPDGAVVRAGLVRHYAARHGLWQLDPHIAYLTGDVLPPGTRGHEILATAPLREKQIRRELAARECGSLEILVRGVNLDPDAFRKRLKLRGPRALSMVVTRIGERAAAFICLPHAPSAGAR
ncbi:class I SAM-dependent methyltransferase [Hoyosella sp. YIM 151337]|uniref:THUMP-like domain-containing protein n=1 Tax=Hoyosella sp. YIM 151337 TaxID=2992742 RepID=UPI002235893F|nr:class I SAM-dependent methyltransferase [Hoyosella sp. YIM 151337]MCW4354598.1 class I SAM-dependent methyltransferase [Hoyosella sp. YIM 151337]